MRRAIFTLLAGVGLAACSDGPVQPREASGPARAAEGAACPGRCLIRLPVPASIFTSLSLNEHAEVAGTDQQGAFVWSRERGLVRLAGPGSAARSVNSWHGAVAGNAGSQPVVWNRDGTTTQVQVPGSSAATAYAINDYGTVVGDFTRASDGTGVAFFWSRWSGATELPSLAGGASRALDINQSGATVGYSRAPDGLNRAVLWPGGGGVVDLGVLPGHTGGSTAYAVGHNGEVVGHSSRQYVAGPRVIREGRAFLWTQAGGMRDLGTLGGVTSTARDVNSWGEVVGVSTTTDPDPTAYGTRDGQLHAFVWSAASGMVRLDAGGEIGSDAFAVNSWGDIVGTAGNALVVWAWPENVYRYQ